MLRVVQQTSTGRRANLLCLHTSLSVVVLSKSSVYAYAIKGKGNSDTLCRTLSLLVGALDTRRWRSLSRTFTESRIRVRLQRDRFAQIG